MAEAAASASSDEHEDSGVRRAPAHSPGASRWAKFQLEEETGHSPPPQAACSASGGLLSSGRLLGALRAVQPRNTTVLPPASVRVPPRPSPGPPKSYAMRRAAQRVVAALPERRGGGESRKRARAASLQAAAPAPLPGLDNEQEALYGAETPSRSRRRAVSDASGLNRLSAPRHAHGSHRPEAAAVAHEPALSDESPPIGGARVTCGSRWAAYLDG